MYRVLGNSQQDPRVRGDDGSAFYSHMGVKAAVFSFEEAFAD